VQQFNPTFKGKKSACWEGFHKTSLSTLSDSLPSNKTALFVFPNRVIFNHLQQIITKARKVYLEPKEFERATQYGIL